MNSSESRSEDGFTSNGLFCFGGGVFRSFFWLLFFCIAPWAMGRGENPARLSPYPKMHPMRDIKLLFKPQGMRLPKEIHHLTIIGRTDGDCWHILLGLFIIIIFLKHIWLHSPLHTLQMPHVGRAKWDWPGFNLRAWHFLLVGFVTRHLPLNNKTDEWKPAHRLSELVTVFHVISLIQVGTTQSHSVWGYPPEKCLKTASVRGGLSFAGGCWAEARIVCLVFQILHRGPPKYLPTQWF